MRMRELLYSRLRIMPVWEPNCLLVHKFLTLAASDFFSIGLTEHFFTLFPYSTPYHGQLGLVSLFRSQHLFCLLFLRASFASLLSSTLLLLICLKFQTL